MKSPQSSSAAEEKLCPFIIGGREWILELDGAKVKSPKPPSSASTIGVIESSEKSCVLGASRRDLALLVSVFGC